jgi:peptidoglycan/xylan/chitin deacetylase (PgdA/CDA1 family)
MSILILYYHRIGYPRDEMGTVTPEAFLCQLKLLKSIPIKIIGMKEVCSIVEGKKAPGKRAISITFDDAYRDIYVHAFPLLNRYKIPATVYAVSGMVGGMDMWNEGRRPLRALCSWDELLEMAEMGIEIGSHTCTHRSLIDLDEEGSLEEIMRSKEELEKGLGISIDHFSYPYGHYDRKRAELVKYVGYKSACTTIKGICKTGDDPFTLHRIPVARRTSIFQFFLKVIRVYL